MILWYSRFRMASKSIAFLVGAMISALPLVALAEPIPLGPSPEQLLTREAFLKTQTEGTSVACVVQTSVAATSVNTPFMLWWGSFGGDGTGWTPNGAYNIVANKPGTYKYEFTFHALGGASATCTTLVTVS